jgi:hypothetical protein
MLKDAEQNRIEAELVDALLEKEQGNYLFLIDALSECSNDLGTRWVRLLKEREALPFLEVTEQILREYAKHLVRGDLEVAMATLQNDLKWAHKYGHPDDERDVA